MADKGTIGGELPYMTPPTSPDVDVPPRGTSVDARIQALVRQLVGQAVKEALCQTRDNTQCSKRQKTKSTPSDSKRPTPTPPSGSKEVQRCYACGTIGHYRKDCRYRKTTCFTCGKLGHIAAVCQEASSFVSQATTTPPTGSKEVQSCCGCGSTAHHRAQCNSICSTCGKLGHITAFCQEASSSLLQATTTPAPRGPGQQLHPASKGKGKVIKVTKSKRGGKR